MSDELPEEEEGQEGAASVVLLGVAVEGGLVALAWLLGWVFGAPPLETYHWTWAGLGLGLLATLPMLAAFALCFAIPWRPIRRIRVFSEDVLRPIMAPCSLLDLAGLAVLAGLGEEMLFRGVFQPLFARWIGDPWIALLVVSLLFGVLHAVTPTYAIFAAIMGAYLGLVAILTDNLMVVVIAHALYDFIALVVLVRWTDPPTPQPTTGG